MAYEFKPLSGVEFTETVGENANMLVVDNGVVKQAPAASGGGMTVFYVSGDRLYKTADYETSATKADVEAAVNAGPIYVCGPDYGDRFNLAGRVFISDYYAYVGFAGIHEDDGDFGFKDFFSAEYFEYEGEG